MAILNTDRKILAVTSSQPGAKVQTGQPKSEGPYGRFLVSFIVYIWGQCISYRDIAIRMAAAQSEVSK